MATVWSQCAAAGPAPKTQLRADADCTGAQRNLRERTRPSLRSDRFLQLLGGAEGDLLRRLDLDRLAGRRVAAHARRALADLQHAETADADLVALLQVLGDHRHQVLEHRGGLLLRDVVRFRERSPELAERDSIDLRSGFFSHRLFP